MDKRSQEQIVASNILQSFIVEKICASPTVFVESNSEKKQQETKIVSE
jgi:hypothetical protein